MVLLGILNICIVCMFCENTLFYSSGIILTSIIVLSPVPTRSISIGPRDKAQPGQVWNTLFIIVCPSDCIPSFKLSNTTTEACKGFSLVLECSTRGKGATVFKGDLLNCSNTNNDIDLLHSRFDNGTNGTCNDDKILGQSLSTNDTSSCYTSLLCIMVSPDMVGKNVRCVHDNGMTEEDIGNFSIPSSTTATTTTHLTGNF